VGKEYCGEAKVEGFSADTQVMHVPINFLLNNGTENVNTETGSTKVVIKKEGFGKMYYRIGINLLSINYNLEAVNSGFEIFRTFSNLDQVKIREEKGVYNVKKGTMIKVEIEFKAHNPRFNVALVEKLAGGFTVENKALKNLQPVEDSLKSSVRGPWFEHFNVWDDRVECFAGNLAAGTFKFEYIVCASLAGEFIVPPAKIEEMYRPEIYGSTSSSKIVIS